MRRRTSQPKPSHAVRSERVKSGRVPPPNHPVILVAPVAVTRGSDEDRP